jgi:hypothetical protein
VILVSLLSSMALQAQPERPVTPVRGAAMCAAAADMLVAKHDGGEDLQALAAIWRQYLAIIEPDAARQAEAVELERVTFDRGDPAQATVERSFATMYLRTACLSQEGQTAFLQRYSGAQ